MEKKFDSSQLHQPVFIPIASTHKPPVPIFEWCSVKSVGALGVGFGAGCAMSVVMHGMGGISDPLSMSHPGYDKMSGWQQTKLWYKNLGRRMVASGKSFGSFAFLFSCTECVIEKKRGVHDSYGTFAAGSLTGGLLAIRGGPQTTLFAAIGAGALTSVIDWYMAKAPPHEVGHED